MEEAEGIGGFLFFLPQGSFGYRNLKDMSDDIIGNLLIGFTVTNPACVVADPSSPQGAAQSELDQQPYLSNEQITHEVPQKIKIREQNKKHE